MKKYFSLLIKMTAYIMTAALIVLSFPSCSGRDLPGSTEEELETVLRIGKYDVPYEQYRYFFMNYKYGYDGGDDEYWSKNDADAALAEIKSDTNEALLRCYATFDLCEKYGIDPYSDDIEDAIDAEIDDYIDNEYGGEQEFLDAISSAYMNVSVMRFVLRRFECDSRLSDALIAEGVIKDDDETVMAAITDPDEFCHAKQILIKNDPGEDPDENLRIATEALTNAQIGADFDALVARYGEDPEMITNPAGYYFTHNELIEEFEAAAFALEVGELSGIVESDIGYHIIQRCELDPSYVSVYFDSLKDAYLAWRYQHEVEASMQRLNVAETDRSSSFGLDDFKY